MAMFDVSNASNKQLNRFTVVDWKHDQPQKPSVAAMVLATSWLLEGRAREVKHTRRDLEAAQPLVQPLPWAGSLPLALPWQRMSWVKNNNKTDPVS